MANAVVRNAVGVVTPNYTVGHLFLFKSATILEKILRVIRKIRLYSNPRNRLPLAMGSILNLAVGSNPTVQHVARFVFGSLSIVKCSEDLIVLTGILRELKENFRGESYILIEGDKSFTKGRSKARLYWIKNVWSERIKRTFYLIGQFFKGLVKLGVHLSDVKAALTENTVSEVVVHANELWRHLSSSEEVLAKYLLRTKDTNDFLFTQFESTFRTQALLQILTVPVRVRDKLPDSGDIRKKAHRVKKEILLDVGRYKERFQRVAKEEREFFKCKLGKDDPITTRRPTPPKLLGFKINPC